MTDPERVLEYDCHVSDESHAVPGPDVRIMKIGDGGFVVACNCGPEGLDEVEEPPHGVEDNEHIVNIYVRDPSPRQWIVLEDAADGWYDTTRWHPAGDDYDGTNGQRRQELRDKIEDLADEKDENSRGGADDEDRAARDVECPECDANPGVKCQRPSGHRVRKSHARRKEKARDEGVLDGGETSEQADLEAWSR